MKENAPKKTSPESATRVARLRRGIRARGPLGAMVLVAAVLLLLALARPACVESAGDAILRATAAVGDRRPAPEIVIAAIDDGSIDELGSWPWPRATFVAFLEKLRQMNAGLIVIDARTASDMGISELRLPIRRDGGPDYVVGYEFYPTLAALPAGEKTEGGEREIKDAADKLAFPSTPADDAPLPAMAGIRINRFPQADRPYLKEGFANIFPERDGIVRFAPLAARLRHRVYPSLSLVTAAGWRGFTPILAQDPGGHPSGAILGQERVATGPDARLAINFLGGEGTFERIPVADILAGRADGKGLDSRLVIVGLTSPMLKASHDTPMGQMPDVEILANIVDNILTNRALSSFAGRLPAALAVLAIAILYSLLLVRLSPRLQLFSTVAISAGLLLFGAAAISIWRVRLPAVEPAIAVVVFFATAALWRLFKHEAPRLLLRRTLNGRMKGEDIDAVALNFAALAKTARALPVTALAIDIKGFSSLVERLAPTQLAEFLKEYRGIVFGCCTEGGGFIESSSGDECTAVFGAPIKRPDHAIRAVEASIKIRRKITGLRDDFENRFGAGRMRVGIGIHTGIAASGDTGAGGSGFGIAGSALEVASQLRAMNRTYRTSALVGNQTRLATDAGYSYRELDPVSFRGEGSTGFVHELIGELGTILPQLAPFIAARELYLQGKFVDAARLFAEVLKSHPNDGPSRLFFRRSLYLAEHPPEGKWHGIWGK